MAYYFHWPYNEIMGLTHKERVKFCGEISKINKKMNEEQSGQKARKNIFDI